MYNYTLSVASPVVCTVNSVTVVLLGHLQDILNHVFDDLEGFKRMLKEKAVAWNDLEKKMKKLKRKRNDGKKVGITSGRI